eukprot:CAMPEP_0194761398 /NCGR_PEP_ID=MMETSP0323_2-20130528/14112_1 /TAXON_ID=2866 ORGANISM="Crypthecodinium cohnii, Strain Seligo" /NCGR_SAMPLE_ID=MMETSP0323_2 /ASSEMBLY_ACC=CAM_ASM_000346 /LENGTH=196 /DNA_ID=CAMNT_0039683115 /DNA_START=97 /DNA_END=684 /DNA_ORIENTATION=-
MAANRGFASHTSSLVTSASVLAVPEDTSKKLMLQRGGTDENGWYSENGLRKQRQPDVSHEDEKKLFGCVLAKQRKFMEHVKEGRLDEVEDYLAFHVADIDINHQDGEGKTALMIAAQANELEMVEALLEARADPHIRDKSTMRYTPLELAQRILEDEDAEYLDVVEILRIASGYDTLPRVRRSPFGLYYDTLPRVR